MSDADLARLATAARDAWVRLSAASVTYYEGAGDDDDRNEFYDARFAWREAAAALERAIAPDRDGVPWGE